MNKNKQNQRLWQTAKLFFCMLTFLIINSKSHAEVIEPGQPNCTVQNTFPQNYVQRPNIFGAYRGGSRWHAGVDLYLPIGTNVAPPAGCNVHLYSDGTPIFKSDPTGYGNYMLWDCGTHGGDKITIRYAHIAGYNATAQQITQGRTGIEDSNIKDHYHFEVLIGNVPVDPQCVLGLEKQVLDQTFLWTDNPSSVGVRSQVLDPAKYQQCTTCPITGQANLCDASVRDALLNHSAICHNGTITKNIPGANAIDPDRITGEFGDPTAGVGTVNGPGGDNDIHVHGYDMSPSDFYSGDVDTLYPPLEEIPEPPPKEPVPPGVVGGPADLVIKDSNDGTELSGCATDTWTAMVNQAVLEARREMIMNQRFIGKADSVLTYTCFDQQTKITSQAVGPIFSETEDWKSGSSLSEVNIMGEEPLIIDVSLGADSLDTAITMAVDMMALPYLTDNFTHGLLGETASVTAPSSTECNVMDTVWQAAKCKNADTPFFTFSDLVGVDPRSMPANLACGAP